MSRDADLRACMDDFHAVLEDEDKTITYTPAGGSPVVLADAIFRSPDTPIVGDDLEFAGVGPQFLVHASDCPALAEGDLFDRGGTQYLVTEVHPNEGFLWIADCRVN